MSRASDVTFRFCGTRGYIEESSRLHRMHSALLICAHGKRLLLDAGANWAGRLRGLGPDWIAITHAHPDHAFGLREGTDCPVYVTRESHELLKRFPVKEFRIMKQRSTYRLGPFRIMAYPVVHSIRAPAVGFRIRADHMTAVYNPDLIEIQDAPAILRHVDLYIGDGAAFARPIIRRRGRARFGHTTIRKQLEWCKQFGIERAVFVHCGKGVVELDARSAQRRVDELAEGRIDAIIARDGMELNL